MTTKKEKTFHEKLVDLQVNFKAAKTKTNNFGKYQFRSSEDVLEALKPHLDRLGLIVITNEELVSTDNGLPIIQSTSTVTDGTESKSATAIVGVDLAQKGMATPQQFGSASSYAKKYSLGCLFAIDNTDDADATNEHNKSEKKEIPSTKLNSIVKAISEGKVKKDRATINALLSQQGLKDLSNEQWEKINK